MVDNHVNQGEFILTVDLISTADEGFKCHDFVALLEFCFFNKFLIFFIACFICQRYVYFSLKIIFDKANSYKVTLFKQLRSLRMSKICFFLYFVRYVPDVSLTIHTVEILQDYYFKANFIKIFARCLTIFKPFKLQPRLPIFLYI